MRITIKTFQSQAIRMGRNAIEWTTEIDITTLTDEQRQTLAGISREIDLTDDIGEITAASIQAYIDAKKEKIRLEKIEIEQRKLKKIAECTAAVESYECGGTDPGQLYSDFGNSIPELNARRDAETARRINAWETAIAPDVEAYLAGGPRKFPSWKGSWAGKKETFDAIQAEDKRRSEQAKIDAEQRKIDQLTDVVNRLGTDVQCEKWEAGLMARDEVIALLWRETFPGDAIPADEYHLEKTEGLNRQESEKLTLTDEQFIRAKKIIDANPDSTAEYYHQYYTYRGDDGEAGSEFPPCDIVRITKKTVGEYTLKADYLL